MPERERPQAGGLEERTAAGVAVDGRRIRGLIPYGVRSRDMGGWTEVIEPTAFRGTDLDELRVTIDHRGVPLGRYPATLDVEDRADGLHWALDPPRSRSDVVEAVERGDMRAGSWRMVVANDRWEGDVRHIEAIAELKDVCLVGSEEPAYPAAAVELRTHSETNNDPAEGQEDTMLDEAPATAPDNDIEDRTAEDRAEAPASAGTLRVEDRAEASPARDACGLADEFRTAGFPGETATIGWQDYEDRAITWTGSVDNINRPRSQAGGLGYDQRYAWPAFPRVAVDPGATAVDVLTQTARSLATAANVVRAIDAVTAKPETGSTLTVVVTPLHQVATIQTNVPNVYLEQQAFNTVIENDLRLAINDGLDKLILDKLAASGFQAPGTDPLLVSVRKAMSTILAAGYSPDTLILTPAAAEALDLATSGISGGTQDFVFAPANFAPDQIFGLNKRISKTIPAPAVVDSTAFGKLYASPVSLARFEADSGTTNRSNVRMELHAVFGVERQNAAVRIAAS